jgi:hypothetical protein
MPEMEEQLGKGQKAYRGGGRRRMVEASRGVEHGVRSMDDGVDNNNTDDAPLVY